MVDAAGLLAAYDAEMRAPQRTPPAGITYEHDGPLVRIVGSHRGLIRPQRDLGVTGADLDHLIQRQRDYFAARGQAVEWKVRGHDRPADIADHLRAAGFTAEHPSTVLIGHAAGLAALEAAPPAGVVLRETREPADMHRIADMQSRVWNQDAAWIADDLNARVAAAPDDTTIMIVEAGDQVVSAAWLAYHGGTRFAALLGGATLPDWQGRGLYRALLVARAQRAAARGYTLLQVDASPDSEPILRRFGFHAVTTTTPYVWNPLTADPAT